jgi:hypothetical protein
MARKLSIWSRIANVLDAIGLLKLIGAAVLFVLFDGSPLLALGIVFAAPVIAACCMLIGQLLRRAATGERVGCGSLDDSRRSRKERPDAYLWAREQPRPRSFATTYIDVTPIKYRRVRSSVHR